MRVILWVCLAIGVLWASYWFAGSRAIENSVVQWFDDSAANGLSASNTDVSVAGFPNRFDLTITNPHLAEFGSGWGWKAPFAQVFTMTWKPWHLIAALPNDQEIDAPGQQIALQSSDMKGSLRLHPSPSLTLAELVIEGHDLSATSDLGWTLGARSVIFAVAEDTSQQYAQHVGLDATGIAPDPALTMLLPELGKLIEAIHLDATLILTAPIDGDMAESQPKLTAIRLADFHANWGALKISGYGTIARAADGRADGKIDFRVENWRQIPKLVVALGLVQPGMGDSIERAMEVLAHSGPDPAVLTLPLEFKSGQMNLGPLPLGPAPMLGEG
jgi:hypothetical protein